MELNDRLNSKYNKDKTAYLKLESMKTILESLEKELKTTTRKKEDAQIKQLRAKQDNEKKTEKDAKEEVEKLTDKIESLKSRISKMQEKLKTGKDKVDGYITNLKKDNPELEEHINFILEKRYNRKIKKLTSEKEQLDNIIKACNEHPTLGNNLKGIIRSQEEYVKLDSELKTLDDKKDKDKIIKIKAKMSDLKDKKEMNTNLFMDYCDKKNLNITKEYLDELVSKKRFAHNKADGSILLESSLKKMQKGYNKQIATYQKAIEKVPGAELLETNRPKDNQEEELETEKEKTGMFEKGKKEEIENPENLPVPKIKWWEFRKRFNAWREGKKLAKQEKDKDKDKENKEPVKSKPSEKFRDAYKYDIVKDYIEAQEKAIYKEAAKEVKNEKGTENER